MKFLKRGHHTGLQILQWSVPFASFYTAPAKKLHGQAGKPALFSDTGGKMFLKQTDFVDMDHYHLKLHF